MQCIYMYIEYVYVELTDITVTSMFNNNIVLYFIRKTYAT